MFGSLHWSFYGMKYSGVFNLHSLHVKIDEYEV